MAVRKLNNNLNVIRKNLRNYRIERHLSQAALTMKLNLLEINLHKNDVYMIENNKRSVKDYEVLEFIKVLFLKIIPPNVVPNVPKNNPIKVVFIKCSKIKSPYKLTLY